MQAEQQQNTIASDIFEKCSNFGEAQVIRDQGIYPFFHPISSELGDEVIIDGKRVIMIGSNNYVGLVDDPRVKEAAVEATRKYGSGCTGSRFLNGTIDLHLELERRLAEFMGKEAALVFSTGFQANLGAISCLGGKSDTLIIDRSGHACLIDGCRLSHSRTIKCKHNDMQDLERVLKNVTEANQRGGILVIVDGVYSMEGDITPLPKLVELAKRYGARLFVDDAHAIGVIGKNGSGTASHFGLVDEVDITSGTFSKSFASLGGFIAADASVIEYVKHMGRSMIFSASIPPANAAAVLKALEIIINEPERREKLWHNAHKMQRELQTMGFDIGDTETPIIPIIVGDSGLTLTFWRRLFDDGVFTNAIISPAVPAERAMLRTSYTATLTDDQLDIVLEKLQRIGKELGVI